MLLAHMTSTFPLLWVTEAGSSETCIQTKTGKETKAIPEIPHCGERRGKTHCSTAAIFHDTKGRTCLLHLRYSHGKVCREGKQSVKRSVNRKHPQRKSVPRSTLCVLRNVALPFLQLCSQIALPPLRAQLLHVLFLVCLLFDFQFQYSLNCKLS